MPMGTLIDIATTVLMLIALVITCVVLAGLDPPRNHH